MELNKITQQSGISLMGPPLESPIQREEYGRVFEVMAQEHADGLIIHDIAENFTYRRLIVELAEEARLPAVFPYREYAEIGGLMSYGSSIADAVRPATLTRFSKARTRATFRSIWKPSSSCC
jgi:putative tryptophan/tyrosine transport system substrate-binding protein